METEETIAKVNKNETNTNSSAPASEPEMCEIDDENCETVEMGGFGGPGGNMDGMGNREDFAAGMIQNTTNEWLVPMTATGIISGSIILSAAAICLTIFFTRKSRDKK